MQDHILRLYRERRDELHALQIDLNQQYREAHDRRAIIEVKHLYEVAARMCATLDTYVNSRKWPLAMVPAIKDFKKQIEACSGLAGIGKGQVFKQLYALTGCVAKHRKHWSKKAREQAGYSNWMRDQFGSQLWKIFHQYDGDFSNKEYITEYDSETGTLHVYYGGHGHPRGPGHGYCKFLFKGRELIDSWPPKEVPK